MSVQRMDNVLIVVDDLEAVKAFFIELGLTLEGESTVEGPSVGSLIGLKDVRATLAMMRTPDGQGIELDKFHTPDAIRFGPVDAPVNTLGIRRVMFAVEDIDAVVARMRAHGSELIGEMRYGDTYRLAYIRGPEGIIVALAEQLGQVCRESTRGVGMRQEKVFAIKFSSLYPLYVKKAESKNRSKEEVDQVLCWLTGYTQEGLRHQIGSENDLETFFAQAPEMHPNVSLIKGVVCGIRVEEIENPLMQKIRYMDKLVDELARGKALGKILRQ